MNLPYLKNCILYLMVAIVTGAWIEPGPRGNETGRFVYKSPTQYNSILHCKICEEKALSSSNYAYMQQKECLAHYKQYGDDIEHILTDKENTLKKYSFCNRGEVPSCGSPPASKQDHRWVCDPGYSNSLYSVYFTCNLTCNYNNMTSAVIYCNEELEWENITNTSQECSKPPDKVKNPDDDVGKVLIPIAIIGVLLVIALVAVVICCLYYRKKKYSPRRSVQLIKMDNVSNGGIQNGGPAAAPLLPRQESKVNLPETNPKHVYTDIQDDSSQSSETSINMPPEGGNANVQDLSSSLSGHGEGGNQSSQGSLNSVNNSEGGNCNSQVRTNSINSTGKRDSQNSQSLSEKESVLTPVIPSSVSTSTSNGGQSASIEVHVFEAKYQSVNHYPSKNLQVTREGYSVPLFSYVVFNPVVMDGTVIKNFIVERKDGLAYAGKPLGLKHFLEKVREEDEGLYTWTIVPSEGDPISNSFQLYIVRPQDQIRERLGPEGQEENIVLFSGGQHPQQTPQNSAQNPPAVIQASGTNTPATPGPTSYSDPRSNYSHLDPNSILGSNPGSDLGSGDVNVRSNPGDVVRSERGSYPLSVDRPMDFSPVHLRMSSLLTNSTDNNRQASNLRNNYRDDSRNENSPRLSNAECNEECTVPLEARPEPSGTSVEIPICDSIEDNTQYDDEDDEQHITPPKIVYERTHGD